MVWYQERQSHEILPNQGTRMHSQRSAEKYITVQGDITENLNYSNIKNTHLDVSYSTVFSSRK